MRRGHEPGVGLSPLHEVNLKVLEEQVQLAQVVVLKLEEVVCDPWEYVLKARDSFPAAVERAQHERLTRAGAGRSERPLRVDCRFLGWDKQQEWRGGGARSGVSNGCYKSKKYMCGLRRTSSTD